MRIVTCLVGGFLIAAASAAGAQPMAPSHQHQGTAPHEAMGQMTASGEKCCCEEMMKKMMSEMMQKHQGMGMQMQKDAPQAPPDHAH